MTRLLPAAALPAALAGCALLQIGVALQDFSLGVNSTTGGRICYQEVNSSPQPRVGSLTISGVARYPAEAGSPNVSADFRFFARTTAPSGGLACVAASSADEQVGSVSIARGGSDVAYAMSGASLTEGVRSGRYWIGAAIANGGSLFGGLIGDYGTVFFQRNVATVTLR